MTRITFFLLLAASLLVAFGLSASRQDAPRDDPNAGGRPATVKAFPSTGTTIPRVMPDKYRVLLTRSIFAQDGHGGGKVVRGGVGGPGLWVGPPGTEATLVFRGVTLSNGAHSAYIEDMTGGGIRRFSRGDVIAAGHIANITLDGLDYESGKQVNRVVLGQNLAGAVVPLPTPPPTTAPVPPASDGKGQRGPGRDRPPGGAPEPLPVAPGQ